MKSFMVGTLGAAGALNDAGDEGCLILVGTLGSCNGEYWKQARPGGC